MKIHQVDLFPEFERCPDNHQRVIVEREDGKYVCGTCGVWLAVAVYWR